MAKRPLFSGWFFFEIFIVSFKYNEYKQRQNNIKLRSLAATICICGKNKSRDIFSYGHLNTKSLRWISILNYLTYSSYAHVSIYIGLGTEF